VTVVSTEPSGVGQLLLLSCSMLSHAGSDQWPVDIPTCPFEYQASHSLWKEKET